MADDTLFLFSSDNGPVWYPRDVERFGHAATGPWRGMKSDSFEGGHRMPFVARWPGKVAPGRESAQTICFDVFATCVEAAGGEVAAGAAEAAPSCGAPRRTVGGSGRDRDAARGERRAGRLEVDRPPRLGGFTRGAKTACAGAALRPRRGPRRDAQRLRRAPRPRAALAQRRARAAAERHHVMATTWATATRASTAAGSRRRGSRAWRRDDLHGLPRASSAARRALAGAGRYQERCGIPGVVNADPHPDHQRGLAAEERTFAGAAREATRPACSASGTSATRPSTSRRGTASTSSAASAATSTTATSPAWDRRLVSRRGAGRARGLPDRW